MERQHVHALFSVLRYAHNKEISVSAGFRAVNIGNHVRVVNKVYTVSAERDFIRCFDINSDFKIRVRRGCIGFRTEPDNTGSICGFCGNQNQEKSQHHGCYKHS